MKKRLIAVAVANLSFFLVVSPLHGSEKSQGTAADLVLQVNNYVSTLQTLNEHNRKVEELARFIPIGQSVELTFVYEPMKGAGDTQVVMLQQVNPFDLQFIDRTAKYVQVRQTVIGDGTYVSEGAPIYAPFDRKREERGETVRLQSNPHEHVRWNQWLEQKEAWLHERRERLQAEPPIDPEGVAFSPQVDMEWLQRTEEELRQLYPQVMQTGDADLQATYDTTKRLLERAEANQPQGPLDPGGILIGRKEAELIAGKLSVKAFALDPESGVLTIEGEKSEVGLDGDLLATALRLVYANAGDASFSLEPLEERGADWGRRTEVIERALEDRIDNDPDFVKRFGELAFELKDIKGTSNLIAFLDQLDPELAQSVRQEVPMTDELVFDPVWLSHTRFGEILYRADQSLKELWRGTSAWGGEPSRALHVLGYVPPRLWRDEGEEESDALRYDAKRWWFTPSGGGLDSGHVIDVSQVQPVLNIRSTYKGEDVIDFIKERDEALDRARNAGVSGLASDLLNESQYVHFGMYYEPATKQFTKRWRAEWSDDPEDPWITPWDLDVQYHVDNHFDAYARAIPEWEELRQIFRAYVFALWLKQKRPDIGQELLEHLPPPRPLQHPLPAQVEHPRFLVARLSSEQGAYVADIEQLAIYGGISFTPRRLSRTPRVPAQAMGRGSGHTSRGVRRGMEARPNPGARAWTKGRSVFVRLSIPGIHEDLTDGSSMWLGTRPTKDSPSEAGYREYRHELLKERGFVPAWSIHHYGLFQFLWILGAALLGTLCLRLSDHKHHVSTRALTGWIALVSEVLMLFAFLLCIAKRPPQLAHWQDLPWWMALTFAVACGGFIWSINPFKRKKIEAAPVIRFGVVCIGYLSCVGMALVGMRYSSGLVQAVFMTEVVVLLVWVGYELVCWIFRPLEWLSRRIVKKEGIHPSFRWGLVALGLLSVLVMKPDLNEFRQAWVPRYDVEVDLTSMPGTPLMASQLYPIIAASDHLPLSAAEDQRQGLLIIIPVLALIALGVEFMAGRIAWAPAGSHRQTRGSAPGGT